MNEEVMICQDCGREDPPCGFYPMEMWSMDSEGKYLTKYPTHFLCHDCEKKRRALSDLPANPEEPPALGVNVNDGVKTRDKTG